jgi:hypothetical protein
MPNIILNRIRTPDGTILTSRSRNDYVSYTDESGIKYSIDGGLDYLKRQTSGEYVELSKYDEEHVNQPNVNKSDS